MAVHPPSRLRATFLLKLIRPALGLAAALLVVLGVTATVLTYRVMTIQNETEAVTPAAYLLSSYVPLNFKDREGGEHEGWLLLGLKGAPAVIISHGYNSNRSDMLPLATALHENHFNAYVYNFACLRAKRFFSDLGVRQAAELMQAIETVTRQPGVNPHRVGLFGTNLGGYASLVAAAQSPKVKALAVDTIYETPEQMLKSQVDQSLGGSSPFFRFLTGAEFRLFTLKTRPYRVRENLPKLENTAKLFIVGRDVPSLAGITEGLYAAAPPPKQLRVMEHSQSTLASSAEKKEYENQVITFFLDNLSLRAD
jgi:esterase/lipase